MDRFDFHFEPKKGWMNDPNGLIRFKGRYHIFFQHNPFDIKWGPMHWGHAVSRDLLSFEEQDIALYPDKEYENDGGCFSGSAIEKDGKIYLFYTSVSKELGQTQSVAFSEDGFHFTKYEGNPVIRHFPENDGSTDFRDPKVFKYGDSYRMVVGTKALNRESGKWTGRVLMYESENLFNWNYLGILYEADDYFDTIECPDLFRIGGRWILMYSKIGENEYPVEFLIGNFDGFKFAAERKQMLEAGPQFYAPQTFEDEDGSRVLFGWFYDWKRMADKDAESAGALTLPRIIREDGDRLTAEPYIMEKNGLKTENGVPYGRILRNIKAQEDEKNVSSLSDIKIILSKKGLKVINAEPKKVLYEYKERIESISLSEDKKACEIFIDGGRLNITCWRLPKLK